MSRTLDEQHIEAKARYARALKAKGERSIFTMRRLWKLQELTKSILRRDMRRTKLPT